VNASLRKMQKEDKIMMSLPNFLSIFRLVLTPVIIIFILKEMFARAFFVFMLAALSDMLDGYLARKYHSITELGRFLDPFSDKLLLVSSFYVLSLMNFMPWWLFFIVLIKEIIMLIGWLTVRSIIKDSKINPNIYGKTASVFLMLLVLCTLACNLSWVPHAIFPYLKTILLYGSVVFIFISLLVYLITGLKELGLRKNDV
jgi:cardiolipin synthase